MNPMKLMKIKKMWEDFQFNHPKFPMFIKAVQREGVKEDSVVEINITNPDGKVLTSNIKLDKSDIEMLEELMKI